jgi:hypothetical protein
MISEKTVTHDKWKVLINVKLNITAIMREIQMFIAVFNIFSVSNNRPGDVTDAGRGMPIRSGTTTPGDDEAGDKPDGSNPGICSKE